MNQRGNTLLEIVFATAVFAVMLIAVASLMPTVMRASRRAQSVLAATQLGQQVIETVRTQPFQEMTGAYTDANGNNWPSINTQLANPQIAPQLPGFPNVQVGNAVYTCVLSVAAATSHPDNTPRTKNITITVSWDSTVPPVTFTTAAYDTINQ